MPVLDTKLYHRYVYLRKIIAYMGFRTRCGCRHQLGVWEWMPVNEEGQLGTQVHLT